MKGGVYRMLTLQLFLPALADEPFLPLLTGGHAARELHETSRQRYGTAHPAERIRRAGI